MRDKIFDRGLFKVTVAAAVLIVVIAGLSGHLAPVFTPMRSVTYKLSGIIRGAADLLVSNDPVDTDLPSAELVTLRRENAILRSELNLPERKDNMLLNAEVIARNTHALRRIITINRGRGDGVRVGSEVFSGGYFVGVVDTSKAKSSEVRLLNDPLFRTTVIVGNQNNEGLLIGEISGVIVEKVPITSDIKVGDKVFSSGLDGYVRRGLPIGQVAQVSKSSNEVFYSLIVQTPLSFEHLEVVKVSHE